MTPTPTRSPVDALAESIFDAASKEAHAYIGRIATNPQSQPAVEARLGCEVGHLHAHIRQLAYRVLLAEDRVKRLTEQLAARPLPEDEGEPEMTFEDMCRETANFVRSTGAADVLRRAA